MNKLIALILAAALAAMPLLSCAADDGADSQHQNDPGAPEAGGETTANGEPDEESPEELRFPDLPDTNFGGYDFRILNMAEGGNLWIIGQLVAEEETGVALNDAIFRRNRRMEERFGFNLVQIDAPGPVIVRDRLRTSVQAGSDDFDLGMSTPLLLLPMAQEGMLERFDSMPYVDLSRPWWDQDMARDLSIGGRLFFMAGDFTFNHYSVAMCLLFNKQLHADLGLDNPYELVHAGKWTIERFAEMGRAALRDLNGDGVFDHRDQWGFLSPSHVYAVGIMSGLGAVHVIKDYDDMPVLNINTEGFVSRFLTAFDILNEGWHFDNTRFTGIPRMDELFLNNQILFWSELMGWATTLRAMDNDFGILPLPKLNEQQESHITGMGQPHVKAVPITTQNLERTGLILEALCAESRLTTLTVYYDTMLVNQLLNRDEESAEMIEIIFSNRIYQTGRQFWSGTIADPIQHAFRDRNRDIVSIIERNETAANAAIAATVNAFLAD